MNARIDGLVRPVVGDVLTIEHHVDLRYVFSHVERKQPVRLVAGDELEIYSGEISSLLVNVSGAIPLLGSSRYVAVVQELSARHYGSDVLVTCIRLHGTGPSGGAPIWSFVRHEFKFRVTKLIE